MNNDMQTQKYILGGIACLGVLIIVGLVWAVLSPARPQTPGTIESGLRFVDEDDPWFGTADARVIVRIFGDFQCPACGVAESGLAYARKTYGERVRFIWKDFPLTQHPNAMPAANAARCAEEQGKFWEYHDKLYEMQKNWSEQSSPRASFIGYARELGLNENTFTTCLVQQTGQTKIQADLREGSANAVSATPTFFINMKRMVGILTNEDWDREILAQLPKP